MDLKGIGSEAVDDWFYVTLDRDRLPAFVNTVMNLLDPKKSGKFLG
jgi:hypothetical protein